MTTTSALAEIAALMADPARAAMLGALMDGRALTASELAGAAGVTPQTASGHLARLTGAGLLSMERQGRHRYHRLSSGAVAQMLEGIMSVSASLRGPAPRVGPRDRTMRRARTCYDHLAGELAVAMADRMIERGQVELSGDGGVLTEAGGAFLSGLGAVVDRGRGRVFCRPCLDWSERRPHIAGAVGAAMCRCCLELGWFRRIAGTRALEVTRAGETGLRAAFGVRVGG